MVREEMDPVDAGPFAWSMTAVHCDLNDHGMWASLEGVAEGLDSTMHEVEVEACGARCMY